MKSDGDTSNFDDYPEADALGSAIKPFDRNDLIMFEDF